MKSIALFLVLTALLGSTGLLFAQSPAPAGAIAFVSERDGDKEIYLMEADGSGQRRLTTASSNDGWPSWSPEGRLILYHSIRPNRSLICSLDPATGQSKQLQVALPGYLWEPAWSSDGQWVAFSNQPLRGKSDIYVVRPDGSDLRRLTQNSAIDGAPRWSPDGTRIAFFTDRDGNWEVYAMNPDGGDLRNLSSNPAREYGAVWSPDGRSLAFVSNRDGNDEIYLMDRDGGNVRRLTASPADDTDPCWSPDGTMIAFASERDGNPEIYTMSASGAGEPRRLTFDPAADIGPAWRPAVASPAP